MRRLAVRSAASPFFGEGAKRQGERRAGPDLVMGSTTRGAKGRGGPGLGKEATVEAAWNLDRISALREGRQEALGIGARGVATIAMREEVAYSGLASPGMVQALLAKC